MLLLKKELVDKIIKTLIDKSALNTKTLKNLQQCFGETSELSLHTSRGVTDEWLKKLSGKDDNHPSQNFLDADGNHSCSSSGSSFHSAESTSVFLPMLNIGDENICIHIIFRSNIYLAYFHCNVMKSFPLHKEFI